jgi:hypothetical protein
MKKSSTAKAASNKDFERKLTSQDVGAAGHGSTRSWPYPRRPPTAFNPHRHALAAHCKSPYRQCSAYRYRDPGLLPAEHCRYGTTDFNASNRRASE